MAVSFIMTKIMYQLKWYENDKTIPFFDDLFAIRASLHCRRFPRSTRGERNCKRMRKIRSRKRRSWSADPGCLTTNLTVTRAACTHARLRASSTRACSSWCRWMNSHGSSFCTRLLKLDRSLLGSWASWIFLPIFLLALKPSEREISELESCKQI